MKLKDQIQAKAIDAWTQKDCIGTLLMFMGSGKSFAMYGSFYAALNEGKIELGDTIYVFSYTQLQSDNLKEEASNYLKYKGLNPLEDFNIEFYCYASFPKGTRKFDVYDEIDVALSAKYHKILLESPAVCKLGLSGTKSASKSVFAEKIKLLTGNEYFIGKLLQSDYATKKGIITDFITKGQLLEILCPIVFEYSFEDAQRDKVITPIETTIINHKLATIPENIKIWRSYQSFGNERSYWRRRWSALDSPKTKNIIKKKYGRELSEFLQKNAKQN